MSLEPLNNTNLMSVDGKSRLSPSFPNQDELLKELGNISSKLQETEARLVTEREERDKKFEAVSDHNFFIIVLLRGGVLCQEGEGKHLFPEKGQ